MIWDKIQILRSKTATKAAAAELGRRWWQAAQREPALCADLIRMGGVLDLQPVNNGQARPLDPTVLAYEAGRRDMALELLTMMNLTIHELNSLMERNDV